MQEELPDIGFRVITIFIRPNQEPEVEHAGFAVWEAKAAIERAYDVVAGNDPDDAEGIAYTPDEGGDSLI